MKKSTAFVLITQLLFIALFAAGVSAQESAPSKWTFMVFINADNNLDRFGILDIQEMEKAAMSSGVNIVAQIDRGYGKPARRYDVTGRAADAQADDWGLLAKNVAELGEVDMGDYKEMVSFVKWAHENYPAENYALVIWNHGAG
ncbi:MAG TPA: clostripain-related cysteine peptidase, partial [Candidatus Wallbacteria bacterium]|nr:clostripain-related cysteine peptidase [Candidatus Wallbacteria bacterium]